MTEIRPEVAEPAAATGPSPLVPMKGPFDWVTSADHRRVGQLYVALSLLMGIGALVVSALASFERFQPGSVIFQHAGDQLASLGTIGVPFMTVVPLLLGLAIAVVPGQVGARTIAFPRAAAFSLWMWLAGSGLVVGAIIANGGPGGGESDGVELYLLGLGILAIGLTIGFIAVATTVLTLRLPGMYLDRTPYFAWSAMVAGVVMVLTMPVLVALLIFLYVDHRYAKVVFGGNEGLWSWISWIVRHPATLLVAIPAFGIVADIVPTIARTRQQLSGLLYLALGLMAPLAFGAWVQEGFAPDVRTEALYLVVSLAILLPVVAVLVVSGSSLVVGTFRAVCPLGLALLGGLLLLLGAINGVLLGLQVLDVNDLKIVGTTGEVAQADLMFLGALLVGIAGVMFWAPRLFGRLLPAGPMRGLGLLGFLGTLAAAVGNLVLGYVENQPAWVTDGFTEGDLTQAFNIVAGVGYAVWALVLLGVGGLLVRSIRGEDVSTADPWDGQTLEWATAPVYGPIRSDRPLLDLREASK